MRDTIDMAREAELDELLEQMPRIAKKFKAFEALVRADAIADERSGCAEHYLGIMRNAIKEAVQAEREACAKVCDELDCRGYGHDCSAAIRERLANTEQGKHMTDKQLLEQALVDEDGENRAVRWFLAEYLNPGMSVGGMKSHLKLSGYPLWPDWVDRCHPSEHLTKAGAQLWIRHLFALEATPPAAPVQEENLYDLAVKADNGGQP